MPEEAQPHMAVWSRSGPAQSQTTEDQVPQNSSDQAAGPNPGRQPRLARSSSQTLDVQRLLSLKQQKIAG